MSKRNKHTVPKDNYGYSHEGNSSLTEALSPPSQVAALSYMTPTVGVIYKYGIPRSTALSMLHNYWTISKDYEELFSIYYLLHWEAGYFQQKMQEGTIEREGVIYQVIYHKCDSYNIGRGNNQLLLSFRSLVSDYEATPTVLVTIA